MELQLELREEKPGENLYVWRIYCGSCGPILFNFNPYHNLTSRANPFFSFFFFGRATQFVGSQFPNQRLNPGQSSESTESLPLDHQGTPGESLFLDKEVKARKVRDTSPNPSLLAFHSLTHPLKKYWEAVCARRQAGDTKVCKQRWILVFSRLWFGCRDRH